MYIYILYYIYNFILYIYCIYIYYLYYIYTRSSHTSWIYETPNINGLALIFSKVSKAKLHKWSTSNESLMSFSIILPASRTPHDHLQGQKGWWILLQALSAAPYTDFIILIITHILLYAFLCLFGLCVTKLHHYKIKSTTSLMKKTAGVKLARLSLSASAEPIGSRGSRGSDHFKQI